jgi:uncharacterized membrane protein
MFKSLLGCFGTAIAAVPLFFCMSAFADNYQTLNITSCAGFPVTWLRPSGIAADNSVVGSFGDNQNHTHGFLYRSGQCAVIDYPGAVSTEANGINATVQIVGTFYDSAGSRHGFHLKGQQFTKIDCTLERARDTALNGINNRGHIVGIFFRGYNARGFIYTDGKFTEIEGPRSPFGTFAQGINQADVVVDYYATTHVRADIHGFIYKDGEYQTLNHPKGPDGTVLSGINSDDEIVGYYGEGIGFLYSNGSFNVSV